MARPCICPSPSSCSPRRTPSRWKAPTRCPRPSSTASCSTSSSTTSARTMKSPSSPAPPRPRRARAARSSRRATPRLPAGRPQSPHRRGRGPLRRPPLRQPHVPDSPAPDFVNEWVSWGAGTRASQNLVLGAKTRALLHNRAHVTADDIRAMALPVLRHRILVNYRAEAEGVTVEKVIGRSSMARKMELLRCCSGSALWRNQPSFVRLTSTCGSSRTN
jgi:hypothetical protein